MKIYLAGPFFNDTQLATIELIEKELNRYNLDYFSPRKGGGKIEHLPIKEKMKESKRIYKSNIDAIMKCDILLAVIDGRDTGTIFEMGYFRGAEDCSGGGSIVPDLTSIYFKSQRYLITYTNENFGLNIMIKEAVDAHLIGEKDLKKFTSLIKDNWDPNTVLARFRNFNPNLI